MATTYTRITDLASQAEPPEDGILSRTLYNDERVKAVVFGFGAGQELSEHTASMPAVVQFLKGEAALTLGDDTIDARPGTWVRMPAGLEPPSELPVMKKERRREIGRQNPRGTGEVAGEMVAKEGGGAVGGQREHSGAAFYLP